VSISVSPSAGALSSFLPTNAEGPLVRQADRVLLVGCLLVGSQVLGPVGLIILAVGVYLLMRAKRAGEEVRPLAVTAFGVFSIVDAATNFLGWSIDTFAHDTHLGQVFMNGFGRLVDGGYYVHYNHLILGGTGVAGEKSWQIFCVFGLFPLRIVASWGFLKLKRWGFDMMLITTWIYAIFWFGYLVNISVDFGNRMGATVFGVVGWWVFDIWYITPFVILPWMYAVNRRKWNR
jgi:hypothetical protein